MTVAELIALLQTKPQDMQVILDGYEGGADDVSGIREVLIHLDDPCGGGFYGKHSWNAEDEHRTHRALLITSCRDDIWPEEAPANVV